MVSACGMLPPVLLRVRPPDVIARTEPLSNVRRDRKSYVINQIAASNADIDFAGIAN